jgi:hypothetical protein
MLLLGTSLACFSTITAAQSPQTNLEAEEAEKDEETPAPEPGRRPGDPIVVIGRKVAGEVVERAERYQARQIRDLFDADPSVEIAGGNRNGQRLFLRGIEGSNLDIFCGCRPQCRRISTGIAYDRERASVRRLRRGILLLAGMVAGGIRSKSPKRAWELGVSNWFS